jgi:hypothetical protein
MHASSLTVSALAAAIIAGASVLAFSYLPALLVWAAFIGWASYDHSGANRRAALRSSAALVFGVIMAWLVALVAASGVVPLPIPVAMAISAGLASFLIVMASSLQALSVVPATFYGFASTFAYLSLVPGELAVGRITALSLANPLGCVTLSLLIGTVLGVAHRGLTDLLSSFAAAQRHVARVPGSSL